MWRPYSCSRRTRGGQFEFAPFIRGEPDAASGVFDENLEDVRAFFDGSYSGAHVKGRATQGSLQLFNGLRSLHRVKAVYGPTARISAVLSYDTKPAVDQNAGSIETTVNLYGERIRGSGLWERCAEARRRACKAAGKVSKETEMG